MKWWLLLAVALTSGCGSFGKPPLPKAPATEAARGSPPNEAWTTRLQGADVIYVGLTKSWSLNDQPAAQIVETMQRSGQRLALGWTEIPVTQQPLFDQWQRQEISAEQLLGQLVSPEQAESLGQALRPDFVQVALGCPQDLLAKIRTGDALSEDERAALPQGFRPVPEAFETFVDRVATSPRLRRYNIRRLYRAHLVAEQLIAENIVRFARDNPNAKLLVFLPNDLLIDPHEIANYAAQKMPLRQLILDRSQRWPGARPQILAQDRRRLLQVVDCAPEPGRDDRCAPPPRLCT